MNLVLVLNTHIPQSEMPWAYEALFNCYLPLFDEILDKKITMAFSPQLILEFTSIGFVEKATNYYNEQVKKISTIEHEALKSYYLKHFECQFDKLKNVNFSLKDLWKNNQWEIVSYPSCHVIAPLVTNQIFSHFLDEGEKLLKDFFGVANFSGVWLPEMAFEDGPNGLLDLVSERYEYIFGNWKTVQGVGSTNRLYETKKGLKVVVRNDRTQSILWGDGSKIAGFPDFRETHRFDRAGNKIFRIGGGEYFPEDSAFALEKGLRIVNYSIQEESGDYVALMFDTEFWGHHWWEGDDFLLKLLDVNRDMLLTPQALIRQNVSRPISLNGQSYTWGNNQTPNGNGTLDTWVNGKMNYWLQFYREALITISRWSDEKLKSNSELLRTFFSSDWLFMIANNIKDIYNPSLPVTNIAMKKLLSSFARIQNV